MASATIDTHILQPEVRQKWSNETVLPSGTLPAFFSGWSTWQYIVTFLLGVVVYDQVMYLKRKGSIAGPTFKIPLMGPFIQALHPKFEEYLAQWASGPLSCVSIGLEVQFDLEARGPRKGHLQTILTRSTVYLTSS
ncbi:hypothetical protein BDP55DRAFT_316401 [Colletotrichum godetiae]|uniref:Uncharacterized protein n=1 Tax=Colletotrichum godetiae TaxID=1209918 RepID=A0AAJ0AVC3_9PEZI|nr:uncharacterized protein BDP55DRAFT_316401 [Colletotrichum godetiae]KAK1691034.1 hypothetical protein BDP55DRAFT_316401 [Colletotrichum godetiae]